MNDKQFVEEFYELKKSLMDDYFSNTPEPNRAALLESLELSSDKKKTLQKIMDTVLTDALYTILLGLEGSATIGIEQEMYKLISEDGVELTGQDIESHAWELFQNNQENV